MKKVLIAAAVILGLAACNSGSETASKDDHSGHDHEMASKATAAEVKGPKDPVCSMPKSDDWTEFSVTGSDTTWFCSPHCKETFDADPAKYAKKG